VSDFIPVSTLAFVFPGQGSQSVGMLAELAAQHRQIRDTFDEASQGAGVELWDLPLEQLNQTEFTQPVLLAASIALWRLWQAQGGAQPALMAGHSLGEYSALVAAGALSLTEAAHLVRLRGQLMQAAVPPGAGAMAAILGADQTVIETSCQAAAQNQVVVPANFNSPAQVVIGGDSAAVERALALLAANGVRKTVRLDVSVPSHTPLMREAAQQLSEAMQTLNWQRPRLPVIQNVDACIHDSIEEITAALVRQLYLPVQWTGCVQALAVRGITQVVECGPGKVLTGLVKRIDKTLTAHSLATPTDFSAALSMWA